MRAGCERSTPMTGSFASDQVTYAAAGHAEQTVVGEEFSRGFSPSFGRNVPPGTVRVRENKKSGPCRVPADIAGAAARVRSNTDYITHSSGPAAVLRARRHGSVSA